MREVVTPDGVVLSQDEIEFAYTREGRRVVGKEFPNPVPLEPPLGYVASKPIHEQIREMVQREMSRAAEAEGFETAEEADDFEIGDDYDPSSPYEVEFEPTDPWPPSKAVAEAEREAVEAPGGEGGQSPPSDAQPSQAPSPAPAKPV